MAVVAVILMTQVNGMSSKSEWNGQNGIFEFEGDGDYLVMVRDTVSCDSFSLTITNTSSGAQEVMN